MPKRKYFPLRVKVVDSVLVIEIGIDTLADSVKRHNDWRDDNDEPRLTVTNATVFAQEIVGALQSEQDDGTTPIDILLDEAITYVVEQGGEGVEMREETSRDKDEDDEEDPPYDGGSL